MDVPRPPVDLAAPAWQSGLGVHPGRDMARERVRLPPATCFTTRRGDGRHRAAQLATCRGTGEGGVLATSTTLAEARAGIAAASAKYSARVAEQATQVAIPLAAAPEIRNDHCSCPCCGSDGPFYGEDDGSSGSCRRCGYGWDRRRLMPVALVPIARLTPAMVAAIPAALATERVRVLAELAEQTGVAARLVLERGTPADQVALDAALEK